MTARKTPAKAPAAKEEEPVVLNEVPLNLRQKLAAIFGSLGKVKQEGKNDFHGYKYFSDEQLSGLFRDKFAAANIVLVPVVTEMQITEFQTDKGKHSFLTSITASWDIHDGDSDEVITAVTVGQGEDPGDKGANKAMTSAFKYLLIKMAQIGGEGDAEADEATDKRHEKTEKAKVEKVSKPVEGVQKGGRQTAAAETQVDAISRLAKEKHLDMDGLVKVIKNKLGVELELPDDAASKGPFLRSFFENLTGDELTTMVQALERAA